MNRTIPLKLRLCDYKNELGFLIVFTLSAVIIAPIFLEMVVMSGNHFRPYPGEDLTLDYVSGVLWATILGISILFWPISSRDKKALLRIWLIKVIVVLVLMLAYEYQYALDPDGYFSHAIAPDFVWQGFSFSNGTSSMQQLTWLFLKIVPGSYHAAKITCALIGLTGIYLYYRTAVIFLRHENIRMLYVLALFPSILLWSSILGKDPITLFGISLYVYGVVAWFRLKLFRHLITLALGVLIVALIRIWVVPIIMLPLVVFVLSGRVNIIWKVMFVAVCTLGLVFFIPKIMALWNISTIADLFAFRTYAVTAFIGGGSSVEAPSITVFSDLIAYIPMGIFTALFRPLPLDVTNIFGFLQGLENVALLILFTVAVKRTSLKELKDPLVLWAVLLVLVWASFYGLVTYNFGALVRYKLQILPVFVGLLLYLGRHRARRVLYVDIATFNRNDDDDQL